MKKYVTPETNYYKITTDDLMQAIGIGSSAGGWDEADAKRYDEEETEDNWLTYKESIWED